MGSPSGLCREFPCCFPAHNARPTDKAPTTFFLSKHPSETVSCLSNCRVDSITGFTKSSANWDKSLKTIQVASIVVHNHCKESPNKLQWPGIQRPILAVRTIQLQGKGTNMEEASMTSQLQDAAHASVAELFQSWKLGYDGALIGLVY